MARKQKNEAAKPARARPDLKRRNDFASLDGQKVAVCLDDPGRRIVFCGTANYQRDDQLGSVLRVSEGEGAGSPAVILRESDWKGLIVPDTCYGCEYCLIPLSEDR